MGEKISVKGESNITERTEKIKIRRKIMKKENYERPDVWFVPLETTDVIRMSGDDVGVDGNDNSDWWNNNFSL